MTTRSMHSLAARRGDTDADPRDSRPLPATQAHLRRWVHDELQLPPDRERRLLDAFSGLLRRQERLWEQSKSEAIDAIVAGFTSRIDQLQRELSAHEATVSSITRYFESVIEELMIRASRDPKTQLMNFTRFLEHLELYLGVEKRGRWCAVGLVDVATFKWYNDTFGHDLGDRIIERVARLLQQHVRSDDLVARDPGHDLHARFGGDEFCFLIPDIDDWTAAVTIADRFRDAVRSHDWRAEHERLAERPVTVDVGVACLLMESVEDRRGFGRQLARELLAHADRVMYAAKADRAARAYPLLLRVENQSLVCMDPGDVRPETEPCAARRRTP